MGGEHISTATSEAEESLQPTSVLPGESLEGSKVLGLFLWLQKNQQQGLGLFTVASSSYLMFSQTKTPWQRLGGLCWMPMLLRQP